ncbi:MAG: transpeptidase family protein [Bacteroidales bacterium]|nr:transpeptidase family protein [Bacteroidales bacterium]
MSLKRDILTRVSLVYFVMVLFALAILGKLFYLQLVDKDRWQRAETSSITYRTIEPNRGNIYSTEGRLLAVSVPYYEIRMDMKSEAFTRGIFDRNVDSLSIKLAEMFGDHHWTYYKQNLVRAREKGNRYYLVKSDITYDQLQQLKEFPIFRLGRYEGGTIFIQQNRRIRPHGLLAARTIGYTMQGDIGNVVGFEGAYDNELSGVEGYRLMQKIPGGNWMPVNDKNEIEPRDGYDIVTTIDIELQDAAEYALLMQLQKHEADHGSVVVMEVGTGKVRAIANLGKAEDGEYREDYNYAIGESTEPGSTFKLASAIALLEDGLVDPEDIVDVGEGVVYYNDLRLEDSGAEGLGKISFRKAFEASSNVGISKLVNEHYGKKPSAFIDRLYRLGLNRKLGIEIKGEGTPDIKYTDSPFWSAVSLPMISIGYEVRLTPLQMLTFYNAIANDGKMVKPQFIEEIRDHGKTIREFDKEVINHKICSDKTLGTIKEMLEGVVETGTAKNLRNSYYKIAGKTGTCQIADAKHGYTQGRYQASFAGYFPAGDPRYSCIVVISSPSRLVYYGNLVAGPIFREITDKIYVQDLNMQREERREILATDHSVPYSKSGYTPELKSSLDYLGIPYEFSNDESEWVRTRSTGANILLRSSDVNSLYLPDVKDMGAKDAVFLLENLGLEVHLNGRGTVRAQVPLPGTLLRNVKQVELKMSITEG